MGSNIFSLLLFPQYLKLMQRNINLNNKKHTDVMKMTNFDYIAKCAVQLIELLHIVANQYKKPSCR